MADLKALHTKWKTAKKNAKEAWDTLGKYTMSVSVGNVEYGVIPFPKFDKKLGPSLDTLATKKDDAKAKAQAKTAVDQYKKDIKTLEKSYGEASEKGKKQLEAAKKAAEEKKLAYTEPKITVVKVTLLAEKQIDALSAVLKEIETALPK